MLAHQQVKIDWTSIHHATFLNLKEAIIQAPILYYPDPNEKYIVYTDASDDACGVQLSQEHDGMEFPIAFLSHTFTETQRKWSTTEKESYGVYYMITKWNYYLQGADITVKNDHKPLLKFLNGKNANNKVNRWSLELATYNITFEWISGAKNKATNCLSWLVELPTTTPATVNMLTITHANRPASNTRSCTKKDSPDTTSTPHPDISPSISPDATQTPKPLTVDRLEALLQMQRTDPFCRCISIHLLNGKAPQHETDVFTHIKGLLYKHIMNSRKQFLALIIPKSWKYTVLVEAHNKLGHSGNSHTYCLIKRQYYWKGMNKNIWKYIANCILCCREKAKVEHYP